MHELGWEQTANGGIYKEYQDALRSKWGSDSLFSKDGKQKQGGSFSGWIQSLEDATTASLAAPFVWLGSVIALGTMYLMQVCQQILYLSELAISPIFIAMMLVPALAGNSYTLLHESGIDLYLAAGLDHL